MTQCNTHKLSSRQEQAIPFLLQAASEKDKCRLANISRKTYYEWMKDPFFKEELVRRRAELTENAVRQLNVYAIKAIETLHSLLNSTTPSIQRSAANDILQHALRYKEAYEIEERLNRLESR